MRYVKSNEEKFIHFKIKSNEQSTQPLSCELDRRNEASSSHFIAVQGYDRDEG